MSTWHFCGMFQLGHPFSLVPPEFFAGVAASLSQIRPLHFDNCRNGPKLVYDFPCLTIVFEEIYHIYLSGWITVTSLWPGMIGNIHFNPILTQHPTSHPPCFGHVGQVLSAPHGYHPQQPALNGVHNGNAAVSVGAPRGAYGGFTAVFFGENEQIMGMLYGI